MQEPPTSLNIIAGRGVYPRLLVEAARAQGVRKVFAVAFRGETDRIINRLADRVVWLRVGQLHKMEEALVGFAAADTVMVGQIKPSHLFNVRPDKAMIKLLTSLPERNAHTIFGAVCDRLEEAGLRFRAASLFMESSMPAAGLLSKRAPDDREQADIELGLRVAKATSGLDIGQTVVLREGTILAVEAFEGTDRAILRGGALGRAGSVVVKVAKRGHDMRFDIPVVGRHTLKTLARAGVTALAMEAERTILLEQEAVLEEADRMGLALVAVHAGQTTEGAEDDG